MISLKCSRLIIFLLIFNHGSPHSPPICNASSSFSSPVVGVESQIAPSLSIKSIQTPKGTVKCSCQTVTDEESAFMFPDQGVIDGLNDKTIEIEIHTPPENAVPSSDEKHPKSKTRNSFTLDDELNEDSTEGGEDIEGSSSNDRIFATEEPPSFLSYLASLAKQRQEQQYEQDEDYANDNFDEDEPTISYSNEQLQSAAANPHPNHRLESEAETVSTTVSSLQKAYKAFRSAELSESPLGGGGLNYLSQLKSTKTTSLGEVETREELNRNKDISASQSQDDNPYFLWDFMYSGVSSSKIPVMSASTVKKKEFLYLGSRIDAFKGPRRRRRRSLRGNNRQAPSVFFVYPEGYKTPETKQEVKVFDQVQSNQNTNNKTEYYGKEKATQKRSDTSYDREEIRRAMQGAMNNAWSEYGTNGIYAMKPSLPPSPAVVEAALSKQPPPPEVASVIKPNPVRPHQQVQSLYFAHPRPFLYIDRIFNPFQPMESEWDKNVALQEPPPPPPEPGLFSRFLARYIDFEVNNHEAADLMRKAAFAIFVGFLLVCWIGLGVLLGVIPLKKWLGGAATKRLDQGKFLETRDVTISELTDRILLSLDEDWLTKLQENLNEGRDLLGKYQTDVFCCLSPESGIVECQRVKKPSKTKNSSPKCKSGLHYTMRFGSKEEDEQNDGKRNKNVSIGNGGRGNQTVTVVFE